MLRHNLLNPASGWLNDCDAQLRSIGAQMKEVIRLDRQTHKLELRFAIGTLNADRQAVNAIAIMRMQDDGACAGNFAQ